MKKLFNGKATEYQLTRGRKLLVSYETAVAAYLPGKTLLTEGSYIRTDVKHSKTTERHIKNWCCNTPREVLQEVFDVMLKEVR